MVSALTVPARTRQHIANFFLDWIRRDSTQEALASRTQRDIRNELLRLVALDDDQFGVAGMRIANELTRWVFGGSEEVKELRWRDDLYCRERILRMMSKSIEKDGAELDEDITDDLLAVSYPRTYERVRETFSNALAYLKNQQSMDKPAKEAEAHLVHLLKGGVEDWELSI